MYVLYMLYTNATQYVILLTTKTRDTSILLIRVGPDAMSQLTTAYIHICYN